MKSKKANYLNVLAYGLAVFIITATAGVGAASAQMMVSPYVYVSANGGSDSNTCLRTSPCRQVTKALEYVSSGGTVTILDSGEYERFAINKSVNVIADAGITANVVGASQLSAISIANYSAELTVSLRGLHVDGTAYLGTGISVSGLIDRVEIDNCVIRGGEFGLWINTAGGYSIARTRISGAVSNLEFHTNSGTIEASVENCLFENGGTGLTAGQNAKVTVSDSSATNGGTGFRSTQATARLLLEKCLANGNSGDGVLGELFGYVRLSNSTITNNSGYGLRSNGGNVKSFGNNRLFNNKLGDTSGSIGAVSLQ